MKVRAKAHAFYNGARIRPGDVFDLVPGHKLGLWMEEVVEVDAKVIVTKASLNDVTTLSEMAHKSKTTTFLDTIKPQKK